MLVAKHERQELRPLTHRDQYRQHRVDMDASPSCRFHVVTLGHVSKHLKTNGRPNAWRDHVISGRLRPSGRRATPTSHQDLLQGLLQLRSHQVHQLQVTLVQIADYVTTHVATKFSLMLHLPPHQQLHLLWLVGRPRRGVRFSRFTLRSWGKHLIPQFGDDVFGSSHTSFTNTHAPRQRNKCRIKPDTRIKNRQ